MQLKASNFCPQTDVLDVQEDTCFPHQPSYATSVPVSMHHILRSLALSCFPNLGKKKLISFPHVPTLNPCHISKLFLVAESWKSWLLARFLPWGQWWYRGKSCRPGQQQKTAHQLAGLSCCSYTTPGVEELPGWRETALYQSILEIQEDFTVWIVSDCLEQFLLWQLLHSSCIFYLWPSLQLKEC